MGLFLIDIASQYLSAQNVDMRFVLYTCEDIGNLADETCCACYGLLTFVTIQSRREFQGSFAF